MATIQNVGFDVVSAAESGFADEAPEAKAAMTADVVGRWLLDTVQQGELELAGQWDADHVRMVVSESMMGLDDEQREAVERTIEEVATGAREP